MAVPAARRRVGPALLTYVDDDFRSHLLQASFQKVRYQNWQLAFGISLPFDDTQRSEWYAFVQEREVTKGEDGGLVKQIATDKLLDADKLERKLIALIEEWGVF